MSAATLRLIAEAQSALARAQTELVLRSAVTVAVESERATWSRPALPLRCGSCGAVIDAANEEGET